jgi:single-strand DNA-binding protein
MRGLNLVLLAGNLGNDPEIRYTGSGTPIGSFSLAISSKTKAEGKEEERVEWVRVVCFTSVAETCGKYLGKGDSVFIMGKVKTRKFTDKDGADKKVTEIIADRVEFLTLKKKSDEGPVIAPLLMMTFRFKGDCRWQVLGS